MYKWLTNHLHCHFVGWHMVWCSNALITTASGTGELNIVIQVKIIQFVQIEMSHMMLLLQEAIC